MRENRFLRSKIALRALEVAQSTQETIRLVFWTHGEEAVRVSACETGNTWSTTAQNGQYHGLFQMGSWERQTYGDGSTVLEQTLAAYRYFVASGYSWRPWECQP